MNAEIQGVTASVPWSGWKRPLSQEDPRSTLCILGHFNVKIRCMTRRLLLQPDGQDRLGDYLKQQLGYDSGWIQFRAGVAFVKRSGLQHLLPELADFAARAEVKMSVGVDLAGSSEEALQSLLDTVVANGGEIWIFHNDDSTHPTFHPKVYLFKKPGLALLIVGSGNLTSGGLFSNYEAGIALELDLKGAEDLALLNEVETALDAWCDSSRELAKPLNAELLEQLRDRSMVPPEVTSHGDSLSEADRTKPGSQEPAGAPLFGKVKVRRPPALKRAKLPRRKLVGAGLHRGFLMLLQRTDVGFGQTTVGTSRRSPEIFIPLLARDEDPEFWGWQSLFQQDIKRPGKYDRVGVRTRIGGSTVSVNMMTWPVKHDFRLRSEELRSAGNVGDILRMERSEVGSGFDYYVEIIPQGTSDYNKRIAQCVRPVRNSKKRYGYY